MCSESCGWQATEKPEICAGLYQRLADNRKINYKKENEHSLRQCRFSFFLIWRDMQYDNQVKLQSALKAVIIVI